MQASQLQNLAWIGQDGQVHNIQKPTNVFGPQMVGSSYTPRGLNLQNLAWLGEDGEVHTVNDNANGNSRGLLGATRPQLQNLAWLDENGQVQTIKQNANANTNSKFLGAKGKS